jgi:hypothetical protein
MTSDLMKFFLLLLGILLCGMLFIQYKYMEMPLLPLPQPPPLPRPVEPLTPRPIEQIPIEPYVSQRIIKLRWNPPRAARRSFPSQ